MGRGKICLPCRTNFCSLLVHNPPVILPDSKRLLCFQYVNNSFIRVEVGISLAQYGLGICLVLRVSPLERQLSMKKTVTCESGITLIELMIAVAIITIGASLSVPEFVRWHARTQLRQATSEIASQLTLARMAAMNRNRSVDVTIQTVTGGVTVSAITSGTSATVLPTTPMLSQVRAITGSPVTVSFSSLGVKTSGGTGTQTFGVCDVKKQQYSVQIIPSGRVNWAPTPTATPCP